MSVEASNAVISRSSIATSSERANSHLFLPEICCALGVSRSNPNRDNEYGLGYVIIQHHRNGTTSKSLIDPYKRCCFVLESEQFQAAQAKASQLELFPSEIVL